MVSKPGAGNRVKSVERAFTILELLVDEDGASLAELEHSMDLARSTIHRYLSTLETLRYICKEGDTYYVGLRFRELGEYAATRKLAYEMAKEKVTEIAKETQEHAQFLVEEHGQGVYLHWAAGERAVQTNPEIGKRVPLHSSAAGKAILAHLPKRRVDQIINDRGLERLTANTITKKEDLLAELKRTRDRGFSVSEDEHTPGLNAIGVAVCEPDAVVIGALSVSGPSHRLEGKRLSDGLPQYLLGVANELELNIAYA